MSAVVRDNLIERRQYHAEFSDIWDKLTLAQKFAASSMNKFGYELTFIRGSATGQLAIMLCGDTCAAIAEDGEINHAPQIKLRQC